MRAVFRAFLFSGALFLFFSCAKEENVTEIPEPQNETYSNVPEALWDYFKRFEEEAAERNLSIDLTEEQISAEIMEIDENGVAGTCTYGSHQPGHIVIDRAFWNLADDLLREMIVFHELGHCSLHRDHREDAYSNGACVSIMRSGLSDCIDNYRSETREVYLNELFGNQ